MSIQEKKFEIFSGTGGVGKTTLATSRAIELAKNGKRVLLITIDPAKRLREILGLNEDQAGEVIQISDPLKSGENLNLDVQLMNPEKTFARVAKNSQCEEILDNRILKVLTRPYGGLNEILSIVELNMQFQTGNYDSIVLDTPPGSHFLDFLDSTQRINVFFDQSFIDIFQTIGKKVDVSSVNFGKRIFNKIVSSGVKKLLSYLNKVTGEKFVDEFIDAIIAIYKTKSTFIAALNLQKTLKDSAQSNWYLVTSVEQNKLAEALKLKNQAGELITNDSYMVINKCIGDNLDTWEPNKENLIKLKESLLEKEKKLKDSLESHFQQVLEFPEIMSVSPLEHIQGLTLNWGKL